MAYFTHFQLTRSFYLPFHIEFRSCFGRFFVVFCCCQGWRCCNTRILHCFLTLFLSLSLSLTFCPRHSPTFSAHRNYLLKKRLSKGPNKIVLSAADFVFPIDTRRVSFSPFSFCDFCLIRCERNSSSARTNSISPQFGLRISLKRGSFVSAIFSVGVFILSYFCAANKIIYCVSAYCLR